MKIKHVIVTNEKCGCSPLNQAEFFAQIYLLSPLHKKEFFHLAKPTLINVHDRFFKRLFDDDFSYTCCYVKIDDKWFQPQIE